MEVEVNIVVKVAESGNLLYELRIEGARVGTEVFAIVVTDKEIPGVREEGMREAVSSRVATASEEVKGNGPQIKKRQTVPRFEQFRFVVKASTISTSISIFSFSRHFCTSCPSEMVALTSSTIEGVEGKVITPRGTSTSTITPLTGLTSWLRTLKTNKRYSIYNFIFGNSSFQ